MNCELPTTISLNFEIHFFRVSLKENSFRGISGNYLLEKTKDFNILNSGTNFCRLKTEITRFLNGRRLNAFVITVQRKRASFLLSTLKRPGNHASRIPKPVL